MLNSTQFWAPSVLLRLLKLDAKNMNSFGVIAHKSRPEPFVVKCFIMDQHASGEHYAEMASNKDEMCIL